MPAERRVMDAVDGQYAYAWVSVLGVSRSLEFVTWRKMISVNITTLTTLFTQSFQAEWWRFRQSGSYL